MLLTSQSIPPLIVTSTSETPVSPTPDVPNPLTLSQAITEADAASGPVTIGFDLVPKNIPGVVNFDLTNQVWTFDVSTPLPAITSPYPVTIDGYTQSYVTSGDGAMGDGRWAMGDGDGDIANSPGDGRWAMGRWGDGAMGTLLSDGDIANSPGGLNNLAMGTLLIHPEV